VPEEQKQAVAQTIHQFYLQGKAISTETISNIIQVSYTGNATNKKYSTKQPAEVAMLLSCISEVQIQSGSLAIITEASRSIPQLLHIKPMLVP
jgi:hypothetical protein